MNFRLFLFALIISLFFSGSALGYEQKRYNCTDECNFNTPFPVFCDAVYTSQTDTSYKVDSNISYQDPGFVNCLSTTSVGEGDDIGCVFDELNSNMGSTNLSYQLNQTTSRDIDPDLNNETTSEIFMRPGGFSYQECPSGTCAGLTGVYPDKTDVDCNKKTMGISSAKIALNQDYEFGYNTTEWYINGSRDNIFWHEFYANDGSRRIMTRLTVMHEMGHALGLDHEHDQLDLMNINVFAGGGYKYSSYGTTGHYIPTPDFLRALHKIHGGVSSGNDGAASAYIVRYNGDNEAISLLAGRYETFCPGSSFDFEFSVHNRSSTSQSMPVKFYLSTNKYITNYDTLIYSTTENIGAYKSETKTYSLTIPQNIGYDTEWYLGYTTSTTYDNISTNNQTHFTYFENILIADSALCN